MAGLHEVSPADFPELECLERGCRTVVVFSPTPLAGFWEENRFVPKPNLPARTPGERAFRLAGNVIAYATGLELPKPKLTRQTVVADRKDNVSPTRGYFQPVQLKLQGADAEPAPAALRNLMGYLQATTRLEVRLDKQSLFAGDDDLFKFKFMYLHGRKAFALNKFEADALRSNLQTGGLLLADACCGKKEFDASFRDLVEQLFPGQKLVPVTPAATVDGKEREDGLFKVAREAGIDIRTVRVRREKPDGSGPEAEMRSYPVALEGIKIDGRWAVVYSRYDLGCAMEGHKSSDCLGHDRDSALKVAAAAVLYSLRR